MSKKQSPPVVPVIGEDGRRLSFAEWRTAQQRSDFQYNKANGFQRQKVSDQPKAAPAAVTRDEFHDQQQKQRAVKIDVDAEIAKQPKPDLGPRNHAQELLDSERLALSRHGRKTLQDLSRRRSAQIEADGIAAAERETRENSPHYKLNLISSQNLLKMATASGDESLIARAEELQQYASDGRLPEKVQQLNDALQSDILTHAEQLRATTALGRLQATQKLVEADELVRQAEESVQPPE
jgi:hypothetical protein